MLLHPKVQKKAQKELDDVIGRDRLPELGDRDSLPYLECVMRETLRYVPYHQISCSMTNYQSYVRRWQPILPLGIPHRVATDDTYRGMRIPKDAIIIANARYVLLVPMCARCVSLLTHMVVRRAITWDENRFHDARSFKPERFLPRPEGAGEVFSVGSAYGWGRRYVLHRLTLA